MSFPVIFRFISGEISAENKISNIFIAPKDSSLNFKAGLLSLFWAILLISTVITILEDFGSLLPARTVTVNPWQYFLDNIVLHVILNTFMSQFITLV